MQHAFPSREDWLDLTPNGRNEAGGTMSWVFLHDEYPHQEQAVRATSRLERP